MVAQIVYFYFKKTSERIFGSIGGFPCPLFGNPTFSFYASESYKVKVNNLLTMGVNNRLKNTLMGIGSQGKNWHK